MHNVIKSFAKMMALVGLMLVSFNATATVINQVLKPMEKTAFQLKIEGRDTGGLCKVKTPKHGAVVFGNFLFGQNANAYKLVSTAKPLTIFSGDNNFIIFIAEPKDKNVTPLSYITVLFENQSLESVSVYCETPTN